MCVVTANVNQNTKEHGLLTIPLATDMTKVLQSCGFALINQVIWNKDGTGGRWGSANSQRPILVVIPIRLISFLRTSMSILSSFRSPIQKEEFKSSILQRIVQK